MKTHKKLSKAGERWQSTKEVYEVIQENEKNGVPIPHSWYMNNLLLFFIVLSYLDIVKHCKYYIRFQWQMYYTFQSVKPNKVLFIRYLIRYELRKAEKRFSLKHRWYRIAKNWITGYVNILEDWFYRNASKLPGRKVYAVRFSRDCDMYETTYPVIFKNWFAYQYALIHLYDDAEGAQSLNLVSKEEYDEYKPTHRDRVMEAFENGNGTSIYV